MKKYILLIVPALLAASVPTAAWAAVDRTCYPASADSDGDGYAKAGTKSQSKSSTSIHCPSGFVDKAADCNDSNATIHPRRYEVKPQNNIDDDCDGVVDEPEVNYPADIYSITFPFGFWIPMTLTGWELLCMNMGGALTAKAEFRDYSNHSTFSNVKSTGLVTIKPADLPSDLKWSMWVNGVSPGRPYTATVKFFCNGSQFHNSDPYYVYTDPADGAYPDQWARYWIVNGGFKQVMRSEHGEVGYRGTASLDGTGYGASYGELWCSEFYARTADVALNGIRSADTTSDIRDFFSDHGSWRSGSPTNLGAGNYIPLDYNNDGTKDHSTMVLGQSEYKDGAWHIRTIEGNSGNEVRINERKITSEMAGEGLLTGRQNMFDSWLY